MECKDILNLIAIIVIPIIAVVIGQYLQNKAEKRKDKMQIFKVLMTSRIYGLTQESVHCLNIIDIVFSDDEKVRNAWKELYDKYCIQDPNDIQLKNIKDAECKLLETMANSLGYKNKVTWVNIQNPYIPKGLLQQLEYQNKSQQAYNNILLNMQENLPQGEQHKHQH